MKVAYVFYDKPGYRGGPLVNARRLLPELKKRGHEVHAIIQVMDGTWSPAARDLEAIGICVHEGPMQRYTEDSINWILDILVRVQPDIFVPNISVAGCFASRWLKRAGIPSIATYRSDDTFYEALVQQFVLGPQHWAVSGLVCVSQSAHDRIASLHPVSTKLTVIPSGVPLPLKHADQQTEDLRIVYIGRLVEEQKRIFDVIKGLSLALQELPHASATLIGHGATQEDEVKLDAYISEQGMSSRIQRMSPVLPEKLHDILIRFHVVILLSDYEGLPGALMDGMACGLVPVTLDTLPGCKELVSDQVTGLIVKDREHDFVRAIRTLAENPSLRARLGMNARNLIMGHYSLSIAADRWERFMNCLAADSSSRRTRLQLPRKSRYSLPKPLDGLSREDNRLPQWPIWKKALTSLKFRIGTILHRSANRD